ncbi:hypothetical protein HDU86_002880 [Geranomyces michiganensis]|nr:hypothetical protein HDU86_002880 [Geranomyces michiganensis]
MSVSEPDIELLGLDEALASAHKSARAASSNSLLYHPPLPPPPPHAWHSSSPYQKMISAGVGAVLTSLLVTPFDVVKTRMQSAAGVASNSHHHHHPRIEPRPEHQHHPPRAAASTAGARFNGTWDGVVKIARHEGLFSLWRGLSPTLVMSVPSTVIYYIGYEHIRDTINAHIPLASASKEIYAPLLAGATARTLAATVISPIELIRTRMQSSPSRSLTATFSSVRAMLATSGPTSLFRGLAPTLWRDVPFSAIYWIGYESIKARLVEFETERLHMSKSNTQTTTTTTTTTTDFGTAFVAGAASGTVAAIVTTPFDVAKTIEQVSVDGGDGRRAGMRQVLKNVYKSEGIPGLFSGLSPRIMKVAPACAVMISSYEVGKRFFEDSNANL